MPATLTGGKRKQNKSLKAWVAFVKKVANEEKITYRDAMMRAKVRKDNGEKWMKGGELVVGSPDSPQNGGADEEPAVHDVPAVGTDPVPVPGPDENVPADAAGADAPADAPVIGGGKKRSTKKRNTKKRSSKKKSTRKKSSKKRRSKK